MRLTMLERDERASRLRPECSEAVIMRTMCAVVNLTN
jgi:hypothetical protein